jgi:hypothetical protein
MHSLQFIAPRDAAVLADVWRHRYLTSAHLTRLHFSHPKLAQRRLRALTTAGLLQRFAPSEARRAGFQTWWYALSRAGARLVSEAQGLPLAEVLPPTRMPRTLGFLAHHALVTDFRLWLAEACASTPEFALRYLPGDTPRGEGRRAALPLSGGRVVLPDGAFVLSRGERHALFLLEADRATEPLTGTHPSSLTRKLLAYREAYDTRAEAHLAALLQARVRGFRILCVVPTDERQRRLVELAVQLDLAPLVWVTTHHVVAERGRLERACWAVSPDDRLHALSE